ncbi:unnamed protein product [Musa acuminata subsp. malaccensis]|uniref:(wild Malaysian banana) hypothetical protein n=1 Tax=Musa acuminata subsp. malaccensis TaxID=214687 RepID=A0A804HMG4_MUSAM|nr:unnamed protein product [Musa acuminata subsp. malaccensis]
MTIPFFTFSIIAGIVAIFSATSAQRVELLSLQKKMLSKSKFVIDAWDKEAQSIDASLIGI